MDFEFGSDLIGLSQRTLLAIENNLCNKLNNCKATMVYSLLIT